ncbi:unnamed protein product [Meloidogyne enterolobii]|uniref:Uncharacterized protein n=1 Tax=Meloidogyne enterolobii TaxID=390850 RepID=A0ACB1AZK6_MELEN
MAPLLSYCFNFSLAMVPLPLNQIISSHLLSSPLKTLIYPIRMDFSPPPLSPFIPFISIWYNRINTFQLILLHNAPFFANPNLPALALEKNTNDFSSPSVLLVRQKENSPLNLPLSHSINFLLAVFPTIFPLSDIAHFPFGKFHFIILPVSVPELSFLSGFDSLFRQALVFHYPFHLINF